MWPKSHIQPTAAEQKVYDLPNGINGESFWIREDGAWNIVTANGLFAGFNYRGQPCGLIKDLPRGGWLPASVGLSGEDAALKPASEEKKS